MRVLWLKGFRFGPWYLAAWGEWKHAFDIGPVRVLIGRRPEADREAFLDRMGITKP